MKRPSRPKKSKRANQPFLVYRKKAWVREGEQRDMQLAVGLPRADTAKKMGSSGRGFVRCRKEILSSSRWGVALGLLALLTVASFAAASFILMHAPQSTIVPLAIAFCGIFLTQGALWVFLLGILRDTGSRDDSVRAHEGVGGRDGASQAADSPIPLRSAQPAAALSLSEAAQVIAAVGKPDSSAPGDSGPIDIYEPAVDRIAQRYLLSQRQKEVLHLLARGRNAPYIQEKLCITLSTAKSHIYNIYRKLDIHSQQELLAMVEEEMERL